jgi:hypothetical protein
LYGAAVDQSTKERLARNEEIFRIVNERIEDQADRGSELEYVCECSNPGCVSTIRLSHEEYRHVRLRPAWFLVCEGHELQEIEHVVERHGGYLIVEKDE